VEWRRRTLFKSASAHKRGDYLPDVFREPVSDLKETDKEVIASIEMPGVSKKDIQLNVTEDGLKSKSSRNTR